MLINPFHPYSSNSAPVSESSLGCRSHKSVCWNKALSESERAKRFAEKAHKLWHCQIYNKRKTWSEPERGLREIGGRNLTLFHPLSLALPLTLPISSQLLFFFPFSRKLAPRFQQFVMAWSELFSGFSLSQHKSRLKLFFQIFKSISTALMTHSATQTRTCCRIHALSFQPAHS